MKLIIIFCISTFIINFSHASVTHIDSMDIKTISYVLASNKGFGKSSFGHAYLRFSKEDSLRPSDIVIEFVADIEKNQEINILKGIGIGKKYGVKIAKSSFNQISEYHNIKEDRDLTTYTLNLSNSQKIILIEKINYLLIHGTTKKYSFFTTNCADFVTEVLNTTLDNNITGVKSVIPISIPDLLRKRNLIISQFTNDRISTNRKEIFENYDSYLKDLGPFSLNIKNQITSSNLQSRVYGYYKLHILRKDLSKAHQRKFNSLANKLLKYESIAIKSYFIPLFMKARQSVKRIPLKRFKISKRRKRILKKIFLTNEGHKVFLNFMTSYKKFSRGSKKRVKEVNHSQSYRLQDLYFKDGKITNSSNEVISYKFDRKLTENGFYNTATYLNGEIIEYKGITYFEPFLITEVNQKKQFSSTPLNHSSMLSIKNGDSKDGFCFAHSELTNLLTSRSLFLPKEAALSEQENLGILHDLQLGKVVIIPGYSNSLEFSNSFDKNTLLNFITKRQVSKFGFRNMMKNYFDEIKIDSSNFYNIKNLLSLNLNPIIFFKLESRIGFAHSITISSIREDDYYIHINAIDSNFGYVKDHFKFNKKTSVLETSFYGDTKIILPGFNLEENNFKATVFQSKMLKKAVVNTFKQIKKFSFYPSEFYLN